MARNDGVDRTSARNANIPDSDIGKTQLHNEREKEIYSNEDIVPERTTMNVHYKTPTGSYREMFAQMEKDGIISTRGLKKDANKYGELIFDVNSAYFHNHGGYEYAKQFYADAYQAAIKIVGDERYILSAVMHADERNSAMSAQLGQDVYHYHLHVVYIPVVEKQILWSKRCKDKVLVGTVKETIHQVSSSKKWASQPVLDENGEPKRLKNGKVILKRSYSILQDDFFEYIKAAGYTDVERGERGSDEEHLSVTQFKVQQEQKRLDALEAAADKKEATIEKYDKKLKVQKEAMITYGEIESIGTKGIMGKVSMTPDEANRLKTWAKEGVASRPTIIDLKQKLKQEKRETAIWKGRYEELHEQTKDFVTAMKRAPEMVKNFLRDMLHGELIASRTRREQTIIRNGGESR